MWRFKPLISDCQHHLPDRRVLEFQVPPDKGTHILPESALPTKMKEYKPIISDFLYVHSPKRKNIINLLYENSRKLHFKNMIIGISGREGASIYKTGRLNIICFYKNRSTGTCIKVVIISVGIDSG